MTFPTQDTNYRTYSLEADKERASPIGRGITRPSRVARRATERLTSRLAIITRTGAGAFAPQEDDDGLPATGFEWRKSVVPVPGRDDVRRSGRKIVHAPSRLRRKDGLRHHGSRRRRWNQFL